MWRDVKDDDRKKGIKMALKHLFGMVSACLKRKGKKNNTNYQKYFKL